MVANDNFPLGAIPLFVTGSQEYSNCVYQVIQKLNSVYSEFLQSDEGSGFSGQVCMEIVYIPRLVLYVTYNKGVSSGFRDIYNSYRIGTKRTLPK